MLGRVGIALVLFAVLSSPASAQPASDKLNEQQTLGRQLTSQYCSLCHLRANITVSETIAPILTKDSAGGRDDVLREVIGNGTPRMPGFKYLLEAAQIDAIIAYLKTVPVPGAPAR